MENNSFIFGLIVAVFTSILITLLINKYTIIGTKSRKLIGALCFICFIISSVVMPNITEFGRIWSGFGFGVFTGFLQVFMVDRKTSKKIKSTL